MRKRRHQHDYLPQLILTAFLLLGSTHCFCRFDMNSKLEALFAHAWAEPVAQQQAVPGQPAEGSVPAGKAGVLTQVFTIARNPFMAPSIITTDPQKAVPAGQKNAGGPGGGHDAAPVPAAVPPTPILRGIVTNGSNSAAIIDYGGKSGFYRVGQYVGGQQVESINEHSVDLSGGTNLYLGR